MQSLFEPKNEHESPEENKQIASPVLQLIVALLVGILFVGGWIAYRYEQEIQRQESERCGKAHADLLKAGVYGQSTAGIKDACGSTDLTTEEKARFIERRNEVEKSIREFQCKDALERYGLESE